MDQHRRRRNTKLLGVLILLGIAYGCLLYYLPTLTGRDKLDGSIGVMLGLYICSHPTANVLDILFFGRIVGHPGSSRRSDVLWLALNLLTLLVGSIVIFIGTTRFVSGAA